MNPVLQPRSRYGLGGWALRIFSQPASQLVNEAASAWRQATIVDSQSNGTGRRLADGLAGRGAYCDSMGWCGSGEANSHHSAGSVSASLRLGAMSEVSTGVTMSAQDCKYRACLDLSAERIERSSASTLWQAPTAALQPTECVVALGRGKPAAVQAI